MEQENNKPESKMESKIEKEENTQKKEIINHMIIHHLRLMNVLNYIRKISLMIESNNEFECRKKPQRNSTKE